MLKIGVTGGIGSGKTTVSHIFEVLGVKVFYADDAAKQAMTTDGLLIEGICQTFGNEAYFADGSLNRKYIANLVFNNPQELAKLNALVHPAVFRAFDAWVAKQSKTPYVLKEAALLFESESFKMCHKSLLVTAPAALRLKRVMQRDGLSQAEVESRMARQLSDEQKLQLANYIIKNDDSQLVIPQVLALHQQFLQLATNL